MVTETEKLAKRLVNARQLLDQLFEPEYRPSMRTLYRWIAERKVPVIKVGSRLLFDTVAVRAHWEKKKIIRPL